MTVTEIACPFCDKAFGRRQDVIAHSVNVHPGKPVVAELDAKYPDPQEEVLRDIEHQKKLAEAAQWEKKLKNVKFEDISSGKNGEGKRPSPLTLVQNNCSELFTDQYGQQYAVIKVNAHYETVQIQSSRFRSFIHQLYYKQTNLPLGTEDTKTIIENMKAQAEFAGSKKRLDLRIVGPSDCSEIYYDLTNEEWECVKVTREGWNIEPAPIVFNRYAGHKAQVQPAKKYPSVIFDKFVHLLNIEDEDDELLLKCYIIAAFVPDIPKPILIIQGEQGSAKSTLQELVKMVIDPSVVKTLTFPRSKPELIQQLAHHYVAIFDNVSKIPDYISDELCKAVTGSGFSKRLLYSNDDDVIYEFKRCIGFNGINIGSTKADLLDRGLIFQLNRVSKEKRRKITDIWTDFEGLRAQLLGYVFDILVQVLQKQGTVLITDYPRMADFAEIGELAARSMGYPANRFLSAYYKNIELQVDAALEANPVGLAIVKLMDEKPEWSGNSTQLLGELDVKAAELGIKTDKDQGWPKAPNSLSRRLNEVRTNLREIGITVEKGAGKVIVISKISKISNIESFGQNHAQNNP
jgi:hypothetical protein